MSGSRRVIGMCGERGTSGHRMQPSHGTIDYFRPSTSYAYEEAAVAFFIVGCVTMLSVEQSIMGVLPALATATLAFWVTFFIRKARILRRTVAQISVSDTFVEVESRSHTVERIEFQQCVRGEATDEGESWTLHTRTGEVRIDSEGFTTLRWVALQRALIRGLTKAGVAVDQEVFYLDPDDRIHDVPSDEDATGH